MIKGEVLSALLALISFLLSFVGYYFYIRSEVYKKTEDAVNNAEAQGTVGKEKLKAATEQLYATVPTVLKPFFSREQLESIVQAAFDKIEEYAKRQKKLI